MPSALSKTGLALRYSPISPIKARCKILCARERKLVHTDTKPESLSGIVKKCLRLKGFLLRNSPSGHKPGKFPVKFPVSREFAWRPVRILPPQPAISRFVPETWVTVHTEDMGNTSAPRASALGVDRLVSVNLSPSTAVRFRQ
jgi:hypothetical protein